LHPGVESLGIELDVLRPRDRVVAAERVERPAVAARAAVDRHDVVVGALLGAGAGESDLHHQPRTPLSTRARALQGWIAQTREIRSEGPAATPRSAGGKWAANLGERAGPGKPGCRLRSATPRCARRLPAPLARCSKRSRCPGGDPGLAG